MSNEIEIKLDGNGTTPEKFLKAVESFFKVIQGVAHNIVGSSNPIQWAVEVDRGSAIVRARVKNPTQKSDYAIATVVSGVRSLRSGLRTMPPGFTTDEIRAFKILASLVDGDGLKSISIKNGGEPEEVPKEIAIVADAILTGEKHIAFGSIEGKIDSLSDRDGFSCSIYEPYYRREIVCYFQKPDVQEEAVKGFRKRVLAGGLIRYAKEGHPTSIVVDTIRIFPEESELPTIEQIREIFK